MKSVFIFLVLFVCLGFRIDPDAPAYKVSLFREHGLDVSWDQSGSDRIAYSCKGEDRFYDIHLAMPDGSRDTCLTCNHPPLPNKHIASPYWHPSGKWLLMVVEKTTHPGSSTDALPGFGAYCDIWVIKADGSKAYAVVDLPNDYDHGVIAPRFSHDGKHIVWTDRKQRPNFLKLRQQFGYWTLKLADFSFRREDSIPVVKNIRSFEPGGPAFYESYGFSPDDSKLIFCSSMNRPSVWDQQIYTIDTSGNNLTKLTEKNYNEHAFYNPSGSKIFWMSNDGNSNGTDWWMMNPDGGEKTRLTHFNVKGFPESEKKHVWAGLGSFNADGTRFVGGVQTSLLTQEGKIVMVDLKP